MEWKGDIVNEIWVNRTQLAGIDVALVSELGELIGKSNGVELLGI